MITECEPKFHVEIRKQKGVKYYFWLYEVFVSKPIEGLRTYKIDEGLYFVGDNWENATMDYSKTLEEARGYLSSLLRNYGGTNGGFHRMESYEIDTRTGDKMYGTVNN